MGHPVMTEGTMERALKRRYTTVRALGQGAQGSVTLVADRFHGDRLFALKTLVPSAEASWLTLFKREFEVLAALKHPKLAQVHDFGTSSDGRTYFTRDYVPGTDFHAYTARRSAVDSSPSPSRSAARSSPSTRAASCTAI